MPDPDWDAAMIADELFTIQDAERMAPLHDRMQAGLKLAEEGKYEQMEETFRRILAEQPFYGRRAEMIPGYMAYGWQRLEAGDLEQASLMYRVALRLDEEGSYTQGIEARLHLIEGLEAIEEGAPDAHSLRQALEKDPDLELAEETLAEVERLDERARISRYRIMGAVGIGSAALVVLALLIIRRLE
jgi:Tfp pilus assembly protein PilF